MCVSKFSSLLTVVVGTAVGYSDGTSFTGLSVSSLHDKVISQVSW